MRCATLAKVELDGERGPRTVDVTDRDEVDSKAADDTFTSQTFTDHSCLGADRRRICNVSGESATQIALSARPAEDLVVGRQQLDLPCRRHPQLHARATKLQADDAFLDDACARGELVEVCLESGVPALELHLVQACDNFVSLVPVAGLGEIA